ncbi:MAG: alpha/beta hydrolase [Casimicrobiaceae bacterium]
MPVDPDLDRFNTEVAAVVPWPAVRTPEARRNRMEAIARRFPGPADAVVRTDHWLVLNGRELLVRLYRPQAGRLAALLYLHGGGWAAGSVTTHDGACATLAQDAGIVVASVQYRRTPENPWPAPNDDCYAALQWLAGHAATFDIDARSLGVGGDSAGAHLAIGVALEARERRGPALALQLLVYPVVEPDFETSSYREHAETATLTRADMMEYWRLYLPPGTTQADNRALPGRASLQGLPPACVVVAGMDPLCDEGRQFAARLRAAGVDASVIEAPTMTHGFLRAAPYVAAARESQQQLNAVVRRRLRA